MLCCCTIGYILLYYVAPYTVSHIPSKNVISHTVPYYNIGLHRNTTFSWLPRRFMVELLLRCKHIQVLESIQSVLGVTSWTLLTYARARSPTSPQDYPCRGTGRPQDGKPLGMDMNEIWDWFNSSPDWMKSCYLCRLFSLCDSELLRMVANLTSVLLVRQKRGFLHYTVHVCLLPGLLDEPTLRRCQKVCRYWRQLAQETVEEIKFRSLFQDQIQAMMKVEHLYVKPFEGAYAKIITKTVQMEERNVYCGCVRFDREDPQRVMDYRGGLFMATGSKDRVARLLYVESETKVVSVMKGHVGSIRAVLLCEDRDLLITASCDASIRCWSLKNDKCLMMLYGHTGTVNCLDVHDDRLVSGAKDCIVKVWSLHTGKHFEDFHFKHPSPVQCVRIKTRTVYSSCDRGLVKIWDMENASLLRVIDAHRSSVKCLFVDEWHFLSGDCSGQVMAWSINCGAKERLMTFSHPKEVKSLTLIYLRVITGCVDGKIRIFNFLTGDCLRHITAEAETGRILETFTFIARERCVTAKQSVMLSEKATSERIKRRGLHHPLTRDSILLRVNAIQKAQCTDEVSINMEWNARLRDSWGPHTSQDPLHCDLKQSLQSQMWHTHDVHPRRAKTCLPILKRAVSQNMANTIKGSNVSTGPYTQRRNHPCSFSKKEQPHSADTHRAIKRVSGFTTSATEGPQAPECMLMSSLPNPERSMKTSSHLPRISPVSVKGPFREQGGFRLLTVNQLEDCWAEKDLMHNCEQKLSNRNEKPEKTLKKVT
uniref:F-box and WD repeat domain containing 10 n=1 Tax=Sander lucioperca TaxID=283035 RepID=A0A8C9WWR6_SANLU